MATGLVGGVNGTGTVNASIGKTQPFRATIVNTDAAPVEYTGLESDSMNINVDNSNRTISGEVKWRSMIATCEAEEDAYHAYPANKARVNFNSLSNTLTSIKNDVDMLENSCNKSTEHINRYVEDLDKLQAELEACQEYCVVLRRALDVEIQTRELDHVKLRKTDSENFNTLKTDISNLTTQTVSRLDHQDKILDSSRTAVTAEESRARTAENKIEKNLQATNKILTETQGELKKLELETKELSGKIAQIQNSDPTSEILDHTSQIEKLSTEVAKLDSKLSTHVDSITKDTSKLRDLVYTHSADITTLTSNVKQTAKTVEDIKNCQHQLNHDVESIQETQLQEIKKCADRFEVLATRISGESTIRRDTDTFHEEELARLELRISTLQSELVQVIQNLADELRRRDEELAENMSSITYDFIDAGNAPIEGD